MLKSQGYALHCFHQMGLFCYFVVLFLCWPARLLRTQYNPVYYETELPSDITYEALIEPFLLVFRQRLKFLLPWFISL